MKTILFFLAGIIFTSFPDDKIPEIKSSSIQIRGRTIGSSFQQDQAQFRDLVNLFNAGSKAAGTTYYLDFQPVYNDVNSIPLKYDPAAKTLSVMNQIDLNNFYDEPEYLQLDRVVFRYPSGIRVKEVNYSTTCQAWINETISFEINDPAIASKIEGNKDNLRLLFVLALKGTVPLRTGVKEPSPADFCLLADLREMLVYNAATNEVYSVYR
jgi:hypothetical protein